MSENEVELVANFSSLFVQVCQNAVSNVNKDVQQALIGQSASEQETIDQIMIDLDGTDTSSASKILTSEQGRKYKIGQVVTAGGMGAILDAKDTNLRRNVAMKVMQD